MATFAQMAARLVDLFGAPGTAAPTKLLNNLGISANGNVIVGAATSTDDNAHKLQVTGAVSFSAPTYGVTQAFTNPAGYWRGIYYQTGGVNRWGMGGNQTAEAGSNSGTDWVLDRFNDSGVWQDSPIIVKRSTGVVTIQDGLAVNSFSGDGYGQIRTINGNYGSMIRNDGTTTYLLSTASGNAYGTWNNYRPFAWNMTNGSVTIAGDGSLTTIAGPLTASSNINLSNTSSIYWAGGNGRIYSDSSGNGPGDIVVQTGTGGTNNYTVFQTNGNLSVPGVCYASSFVAGGTTYQNDGNINGSIWGGYLSSYLSNNFNAKASLAGCTFTGTVGMNADLNVNGTIRGLVNSSSAGEFAHVRAGSGYATGGGTGLSNQGCVMSWNDTNGDGMGWLANNQGGGGGGWVIRTVNSGNTAEVGRFTISAAGVGSNGSDMRLKDNVETLTNALENIRKIRGVSYSYKSNGEKHYGVIAQEVQPYFPDAVVEIGHGMDEGKDDYLGVSYNDLVGPMIEAIKELANKVDSLEAQLNTLKGDSK